MRSLPLTVLSLLAGCVSPQYQALLAEHADEAGTTDAASGDAEPVSTTGAESASTSGAGGESATFSTVTAATSDTATGTGDTTDTGGSSTVGEPEEPVIVSVELPEEVHSAGPVPLTVQTEHTAAVRLKHNGVDAGELLAVGGGLFTGALPVHGAIDNGSHAVEVIATQGEYEDSRSLMFEVTTPKPGTAAWSLAGPDASRTNRVAVTPEGDLIEVGPTSIDGAPRPTIRKRSATTGAELWPEGTISLDTREGSAVDVAVLPDGRMWVAMNVQSPGQDPRARIALLDADGHALGVEVEGTAGRVVRAIAADAQGGCFAVGLAAVMGDWDIAYWRIDAAGTPTLDDTFDYVPPPHTGHTFVDLANDVVIDGDVAWVVGTSKGEHEKGLTSSLRGMLVPLDLHTAALVGPVSIAPADNGWPQSAFFGAALHPEGIVVTGYRCDATCSKYEILTSHYGVDGKRGWTESGATNTGLAYGSDVVLDSQGRALVAAAVTQNGKLRGYVFGLEVDVLGPPLFEHWYPGAGPSEALGIVRDSFDRIFPAGYITVGGETQARITRIHG